MKKWRVKLLLGFAAILFVVGFCLLSLRISSKNAIVRYKNQLLAAGEKLSIDDIIPPHAEPDKNGAAYFYEACRYIDSSSGVIATNTPSGMRMVAPGRAAVGWQQPAIRSFYFSEADTAVTTVTNTWAELAQDVERQNSALALLEKVSERPQLDFGLDYRSENVSSKHLMNLKQAALLLSAAAISDLNRGDVASSVTNLHSSLALLNFGKNDLTLIGQLVRFAMVAIASIDQWELLQSTNVTDQQLAALQRDWQNIDFIQPTEKTLLRERFMSSVTIQILRTWTNSPSIAFAGGNWMSAQAGSNSSNSFLGLKTFGQSIKRKTSDGLWRIAWSYDDELKMLEGDQVLVETMRQIRTNGYFQDAFAERDRKLTALGFNQPDTDWLRNQFDDELTLLGMDSVNVAARFLDRLLACEATRDLVCAAIALKRYQLRHQTLPKDLNSLVPEFLSEIPRDPVDGKPLRYRLNSDGTFILYSLGLDRVDNGGDATPLPPSKSIQWQRGRDWVWPEPATAEEIQKFYQNPPK
jgi:hypothetical protein